jgi:hypothetical protein
MDKLTQICGSGIISSTTGTITFVAGVGAVEKVQAVSGCGSANFGMRQSESKMKYFSPRFVFGAAPTLASRDSHGHGI